MIWRVLIITPWLVLVIYWLISARKQNKNVSREPVASRYMALMLEIIGFVMIFWAGAGIGPLARHIFHPRFDVAVAGVILTWLGTAIALWARVTLGQYWSARVSIKEDHKLIDTGPYKFFRHPIYSGIDLGALGGLLAIDRWRCVVGLIILMAGYFIKAKKEEAMLAAQFGDAFQEHARRTGFLFPKFW